ncbi:MAG: tripartite tricarboxylate transporter substrate binding protein [Burkholderiales bacterium]|nr:tripartite tricarboxylate transporter substrate binding protein [Burkholderiales bacterium]
MFALRLCVLIAAVAAPALAAPAHAQADYPSRPVRLILPNAPGSSIDTVGRALAAHLSTTLGQSVFAENRAGAAGLLGMEAGRTAAADGYTFIVASSSSMTAAPLMKKAVPFDVLKDFDFVSPVALLPNVLAVNPALGVGSVREFVAWARANPGRVNMASAGVGSVSHLAGVNFGVAAGFDALHVPHTGGAQSVASVVSGQTHWTLTPAPAAMGLVKAGRLKALGHSMGRDARVLEGMPSLAETVPGFAFNGWIGIVAPRGVPAAALDKLRTALAAAMRVPALEATLAANGAIPHLSSPAEFRAFLVRDIEETRRTMKAAAIEPE